MLKYYQYIPLIIAFAASQVHWAMDNGVYFRLNGGLGILEQTTYSANSIFSDFKKNHIPSQEVINNFGKLFSSAKELQSGYKIANLGVGWQLSPNVSLEGYPIVYQNQKEDWYERRPKWNCGLAFSVKLTVPLPFFESIRIYEKISKVLIMHRTSNLKEFDWKSVQKQYSSFSTLYDHFMQDENAYVFLATGLKVDLSPTKTLDISWERHPYYKSKVAHFIKLGLDWHL